MAVIKLKKVISNGETFSNPILADGEIGLEKIHNKYIIKVGNGITPWNNLTSNNDIPTVANDSEMYGYPDSFRYRGLLLYNRANSNFYFLRDGITNDNWVAFNLQDPGDMSIYALKDDISDFERTINGTLDTHSLNEDIHVTDAEKKSWSDKQDLINYVPEDSSKKGVASGYASLDASGKVPVSMLPSNLADPYTKNEIDLKVQDLQASINNEATIRGQNDTTNQTDISNHKSNTILHTSQVEKDLWGSKLGEEALVPYTQHTDNTEIHITQLERLKWNGNIAVYIVDSVTEMNSILVDSLTIGDTCYVRQGDDSFGRFVWYGEENSWHPDNTSATLFDINWSNLSDKPLSSVTAIDQTVLKAHQHTNKIYLDKISQDNNGNLTYSNIPIGAILEFYETNEQLPVAGISGRLYICYKDSRVRNYASISVYRNGAFEILGRGVSDAPIPVGDMNIMQHAKYSVAANSTFVFTVSSNDNFSFLDLNVLKLIAGLTNQNRVFNLFNTPDSFIYNPKFIEILNGIKIKDAVEIPMNLDIQGDQVFYYNVDIDLNNWDSISEIM